MSITVRDEATVASLTAAHEYEEVKGPDGKVLGLFLPRSVPGMRYPEVEIDVDEMMRTINDPNTKWHTGEEVMARLRKIREGL